jgi:hypothetical protein
MRTLLVLVAAFSLSTAQLTAQVTTDQWLNDLDHLQQTVNNDYPFLFKKVTPDRFNQEVEELRKDIPGLADHQVLVGFARLVALFGYGHSYVSYRQDQVPMHRLPLQLYQFSDGIYIQGVTRPYQSLLGAKLVGVEGKSIDQVLGLMKPAFPVENEQFYKAYGLNEINMPELLHAQGVTEMLKMEISLEIEKDGKLMTVPVKAVPVGQTRDRPIKYGMIHTEGNWVGLGTGDNAPLFLKDLDRIYSYTYLEDKKTLYVRQSQIQDDSIADIPTFYAEVFDFIEQKEVDKLVLDVRLNGGGNNYKNKPIITGIIANKKINTQGNFMVIIGRRTFSACQNLVNELDNYTNVIFVGEPTGENINFYGDNNRVILPNTGIEVRLSFAWWQDKPQWENGLWTSPHVAVDMSFEDFMAGEDPVLDAALNFDQDDLILDPMGYFTQLFMQGKIDQLKSDAIAMKDDSRYKYFDMEGQFTQAGSRLLDSGQVQEGVFVFKLITDLYPESAYAWNNLGDGLNKAGMTQEAVLTYRKVAEMAQGTLLGRGAAQKAEALSDQK